MEVKEELGRVMYRMSNVESRNLLRIERAIIASLVSKGRHEASHGQVVVGKEREKGGEGHGITLQG